MVTETQNQHLKSSLKSSLKVKLQYSANIWVLCGKRNGRSLLRVKKCSMIKKKKNNSCFQLNCRKNKSDEEALIVYCRDGMVNL